MRTARQREAADGPSDGRRADDSFELYDLRVEVVAPEGAPIYCGAKPGDYFELRGEMLHLPPGQGFSIYSLAARAAAAAGQAAADRRRTTG